MVRASLHIVWLLSNNPAADDFYCSREITFWLFWFAWARMEVPD